MIHLADRVGALGGRLERVESAMLRAELPCA